MAAVRPISEPSANSFTGPSRSHSSPKPERRPRSMPNRVGSSVAAGRSCIASTEVISVMRTGRTPRARASAYAAASTGELPTQPAPMPASVALVTPSRTSCPAAAAIVATSSSIG